MLDRRLRTLERASLRLGCSKFTHVFSLDTHPGTSHLIYWCHSDDCITERHKKLYQHFKELLGEAGRSIHHPNRSISCSGRALCRPHTKPSSVVVAAPCTGLAPVIPQARRDVRSCVRKRRTIDGLTICYFYQRTSTTEYGWGVRWCEDVSPTQSNRTQPVGTYVRASASEGQAKDNQYVMFIDVRQRPNTVGVFVGADARTSVPTVRMCEELMLVDCSLVADVRTSVPTVRGWIIACVTYYSLVRCLRGRHKARPLQWIFVD